jgi:hypothetical protein
MRVQLFIVLAVVLAVAAASDLHAEFAAFKVAHKKHYASAAEEKHRFGVFRANMARAAELNKKNPEARFGASPFADLTAAEFKVYHNSERAYAALQASNNFPFYPRYTEAQIKAAPTNVDWRAQGAVTPVKNQGQWAAAGRSRRPAASRASGSSRATRLCRCRSRSWCRATRSTPAATAA